MQGIPRHLFFLGFFCAAVRRRRCVSLVLASALEPAPSIRDGRVLILSQGVVLPRPTLHRRSAHKVADAS